YDGGLEFPNQMGRYSSFSSAYVDYAIRSWRWLDAHCTPWPANLADRSAGSEIARSSAAIEITTSSSMKVKPTCAARSVIAIPFKLAGHRRKQRRGRHGWRPRCVRLRPPSTCRHNRPSSTEKADHRWLGNARDLVEAV